jgi:23S rRNA-/tRNA-specific pseudouridylate synthase
VIKISKQLLVRRFVRKQTTEIARKSTAIHNGLRHVLPYHFGYEAVAKQRWVGRLLLDVFTEEFVGQTRQDYERSVLAGRITVNGDAVGVDYVVRNGDKTVHTMHRHEPACSAIPVSIVLQEDELLVCDKPPSVPVHPSGRYRHQTLQYMLARDFNIKRVYFAHRLDRLTSGVVLGSTSSTMADCLRRLVTARDVRKNYLALASGDMRQFFTQAAARVSEFAPRVDREREWIHCDAPIVVLPAVEGICSIGATGVSARTSFKCLSVREEVCWSHAHVRCDSLIRRRT